MSGGKLFDKPQNGRLLGLVLYFSLFLGLLFILRFIGLGVMQLRFPKKAIVIPFETRKTGVTVIASKGSGKSKNISGLLFQDFFKGLGGVVIDPQGTLIAEFIAKLERFLARLRRQGEITPEQEAKVWSRIKYDDKGHSGYVVKKPLFHKRSDQGYADASEYLTNIFVNLDPALDTNAPISGINALRSTLVNVFCIGI